VTASITRKERLGLWLHRTLDKRFSRFGVALFRRTKGGITERAGVDGLVLTTVGRRSSKRRSVMLQYFHDGEDMLIVAADGGGDRHPAWFHNLMAHPLAEVEVAGESLAVRAERVGEPEAEALWPAILQRAPDYERYLRATERTIPLIRLRRDSHQRPASSIAEDR
jgi:deazaflavin-dependent oxidoreductase (nitroreductase family)